MRPLLFLLFFSFSSLLLWSQDSPTQPVNIKAKYDSARVAFTQFEKKHGGFIQTKNVKMHYLEWGNPRHTPFIWVHGSFTNAYEFADLAKELVQKGYYVIAIDYYGHGQTPIPTHDVSLYHVADDINTLMSVKKLPKAVVGGWSRGGFIATAFYDAYPEKTLGLVLEDGGSVATNTHYHQLPDSSLNAQVKSIFTDRFVSATFDTEFEAYKAYYDYSSSSTQFELLAWLGKDLEGKWTIGAGVEKLFHMRNEAEFKETILRPTKASLFGKSMSLIEPKIIYRNLHVPLLIIDPTSPNDLFPFEKDNAALQQQHSKFITHKIYPNTGHNVHYEKPKEFLEDVTAFLKRVSGR